MMRLNPVSPPSESLTLGVFLEGQKIANHFQIYYLTCTSIHSNKEGMKDIVLFPLYR